MRRRYLSPIWLLLIFLVAENFARGGMVNPAAWIYSKLVVLPGIIIGISAHEFAHGYASYKLGDPTPKAQGRLTLNPISHIDPFGFIALLVAGFGWGKPVIVDPRYYKHRRRDQLIVDLAGVSTNFILAILFTVVLRFMIHGNGGFLDTNLGEVLVEIVQNAIIMNLVLMIFNLIPIPPLDGFGVVTQLFNLEKYSWYYKVYNNGFIILMIAIMLGATDMILGPLLKGIYRTLVTIIVF